MTRSDVNMLKEALVPKDADYDVPCISPHNLEIVLEQLLLEQQVSVSDPVSDPEPISESHYERSETDLTSVIDRALSKLASTRTRRFEWE